MALALALDLLSRHRRNLIAFDLLLLLAYNLSEAKPYTKISNDNHSHLEKN